VQPWRCYTALANLVIKMADMLTSPTHQIKALCFTNVHIINVCMYVCMYIIL